MSAHSAANARKSAGGGPNPDGPATSRGAAGAEAASARATGVPDAAVVLRLVSTFCDCAEGAAAGAAGAALWARPLAASDASAFAAAPN